MGGCTVGAKIKLMFCSLNYTQRPVFANAILGFGYVELYLLYMIHVRAASRNLDQGGRIGLIKNVGGAKSSEL